MARRKKGTDKGPTPEEVVRDIMAKLPSGKGPGAKKPVESSPPKSVLPGRCGGCDVVIDHHHPSRY